VMRMSISPQPVRVKHMPRRTCVACRRADNKRELVRLVRVSNGSVEVDSSGKKAGRGAYICRDWKCWETGLKGGRLEHALRTALTQDNREELIAYGRDLFKGAD
jgi:predicted RNA-binding protein YlxR (DUF448 family)